MAKRIDALASLITNSRVIADIGTDHAYLIIALFKEKKIKFAYAIDNKDGPINNAYNNLLRSGFLKNCEVIKANGLSFKANKIIDTLIFAGIGGLNIIDIIRNNVDKLQNVQYIITDIHRHEEEVIIYLKELNYVIDDDINMVENKKRYHLIRFHRSYI